VTRARERRPRLREHHELQFDETSAAGTFQDLPYAMATSCDAAGEERSVLKSEWRLNFIQTEPCASGARRIAEDVMTLGGIFELLAHI